MSIIQIKQRLESILTYLQPHWDFVNCHMVNYLTDKHWDRFIEKDLQIEVSDAEHVEKCIHSVFWSDNKNTSQDGNYPAFLKFVKEGEKYKLQNFGDVLITIDDLKEICEMSKEDEDITIKEFMSEKKRHEVEITAKLVHDLIKRQKYQTYNENIYIIDAGDGKGYLSSRLALQYKYNVLGIDCNEVNTENAINRSRKMQRVWNSLTKRAVLENRGITPIKNRVKSKNIGKNNTLERNCNDICENYKTTAKFITKELNFEQLLENVFPSANREKYICLTGLHTCGNLAPTCLKVFHTQPQFKILCNIGCCYHLLNEEFSSSEYFCKNNKSDESVEPGFPMSQFLREKKIGLGRNARMLAAQAIERTLAKLEVPNISLFYRALLEVLICENNINLKNTVQVGKVKNFKNFHEYVEICNSKGLLQLNNISLNYINNLENRYESEKSYLNLFYLIRMTFAPVLESLILLDRLLYLKELNYEQSYLISLFDAVVSPRNFCIVAIKN